MRGGNMMKCEPIFLFPEEWAHIWALTQPLPSSSPGAPQGPPIGLCVRSCSPSLFSTQTQLILSGY